MDITELLPIFAALLAGTVTWSTALEQITERFLKQWFADLSVFWKRSIFAGGILGLNAYAFMIQPGNYTWQAGWLVLGGTVAWFWLGHKWHGAMK